LVRVRLCEVRFQAHLAIVAELVDEVVKRAALDEIHYAKGCKVCDEARMQLQDVRMVQIAPYSDLVIDSLLSLIVLGLTDIWDGLADNLDSTLGSTAVIVHTNDLFDNAEASRSNLATDDILIVDTDRLSFIIRFRLGRLRIATPTTKKLSGW
ncbi:kinase-like protein, partial [Aureobasidium melanogenum]